MAMCKEDQPTISVIATLQAKLLKHLQSCEDDSPRVTEMKSLMSDDLSARYIGIRNALNIGHLIQVGVKISLNVLGYYAVNNDIL